ncbi:MAG: hypothetical protein ACKVPX_02050 [Myxococcaceae bacterium]
MTQEQAAEIKFIKKALRAFPAIVREKRRNHREKEKVLKRFEPMARALLRLERAIERRRVRALQKIG